MSLAGESDRNLGARLVASGRITTEQLAACLEQQRREGGAEAIGLAEILVRHGMVSSAELARFGVGSSGIGSAPGGRSPVPGRSPAPPSWAPPGAARLRGGGGGAAGPLSSAEIDAAVADPARRVGRYVVLRELGRGGMGTVYRGWDPQLRREVAIKKLHDLGGTGEEERLRLVKEARAAARLHHPGIVAVHEVGDHQGQPYLVMDYVPGRPLSAAGARRPLPPRRAAAIVRDVALALQHAHEAGVVHRDVKPHNVLLDESDRPRLVDFGLARVVDAQTQLTRTGQMIGTPQYVSPEQARGDLPAVGPASDIYSLGAVLYWGIVGRPPFVGENMLEVLKKLFMEEPDPPRAVDATLSPDLDTIVMRCLEKRPEDRYATAADLAGELARFLDGAAIEARPVGAMRRARRWARRHRLKAAAIGLAATLLFAGAVGGAALLFEVRRQVKAKQAEVVERARADAEATWVAFREARRLPPPVTEEGARRRSGKLLALGLDAVQAAAALRLLAPADAAAGEGAFRATMAYGEVALQVEQWSLAETLYRKAGELGVDDAAAARALEGVGTARDARARRRRETVERVLADVRDGSASLRPGGYDEALFTLVRHADAQTVALVGGALEEVAEGLRKEARHVYLQAAREAPDGSDPIHGLEQAVDRWLGSGSGDPLDEATRIVLRKAGERVIAWDRERAPAELRQPLRSTRAIVAAAQTKGLGANGAQMARLCCEALARIGIAEGAIEPLRRYLQVEADELRAVHPAIALVRLGGEDGFELIDAARRRFGMGGQFWVRVSRWLTPDSARGAPEPTDGSREEVFQRALARLTSGDPAGAEADFTRVIAIDADYKEAWGNRAAARMAQRNYDGAIADLDRAIELDASDPVSWRNRGLAKFRKGALEAAEGDFARALELDARDPQNWNARAMVRRERGELDAAIADLTEAIALAPRDATFYGNRGVIHNMKNEPDAALADLERAIALDPEDGSNHCHRGAALMKKDGHAEAIAHLDRGLQLEPGYARGWANRGICRYQTGDVDGAIGDYTRAIELDPELRAAWARRGTARAVKGEFESAVADFDRALAIFEADASTLSNRAFARFKIGDLEGAIADATRAIEIDPSHAGYYANRGIAHARKGDTEAALRDFDEAIEIEPNDPGSHLNRGITLESAGRLKEAADAFERFLELAPDSPLASQARQKIERFRSGERDGGGGSGGG